LLTKNDSTLGHGILALVVAFIEFFKITTQMVTMLVPDLVLEEAAAV